jgi:hypothetical protein
LYGGFKNVDVKVPIGKTILPRMGCHEPPFSDFLAVLLVQMYLPHLLHVPVELKSTGPISNENPLSLNDRSTKIG